MHFSAVVGDVSCNGSRNVRKEWPEDDISENESRCYVSESMQVYNCGVCIACNGEDLAQ